MASDYWNVSSKTEFNRSDSVIPEPRELQPSLQCGSHRQGQNQNLCICLSLLERLFMGRDRILFILRVSMMLSTKVKWNQHKISKNSCNNGFGIVLFFPQHIIKITHRHLLIEQYSLGKAITGESKHTLKAQ